MKPLLTRRQTLGLAFAAALAPAFTATPALAQVPPTERDAVVVIGHPGLPRLDAATVQRLYTGRAVEVNGISVTVFNAAPGSRARERFMAGVMATDDDKYVAYWTVRKHIGKGTPPRELHGAAEVIERVLATPGAVGYVLASELRPGLNVLLKP